jgi:outer membrane protein
MHGRKMMGVLALAALLVWGTAAQDEPIKIGIVDLDQAVNSTAEGRAAREELARKQREAEAKIQPMLEKLKEMEEDFKAKRFVISDEARFQKQLDIVEVQNEIESRVKELKGQLQVDEQRLRGPLLQKLGGIIEQVGKEQGFTLIMRRDAPGLLYAREALDVTDLVIEKYNQAG